MELRNRSAEVDLGRGASIHYERDATIGELFSAQAQRSPDAIAVEGLNGRLRYRELEARSNRLARFLRALGVSPGEALGISFERSVSLPIALLGILKAGAAYVPLDPSYPAERLEFIAKDNALRFVLSDGTEPQGHRYGQATTIDLETRRAAIEAHDTEPLDAQTEPGSLAYTMYTSGSTGRPKGVAVEHRGVLRLVRGIDYADITPADGFLHSAPLAFDASTFEIWAPLLNGARLSIPRAGLLSIEELGQAIERFDVTTMFLTTSLFGRIVERGLDSFGRLRHVMTGGEVGSPAHMARFLELYPQCRLSAVYGPTENTTFSTWCDITSPEDVTPSVPIGRPISNSSAYILDDSGEPVTPGEPGELYVGGDGVARGYVNLPELTAERFVRDPFSDDGRGRLYRTGDRARRRPDGLLEFLGRRDDQVKVRGFRIELGEIEAALRDNPGVREAAAVVANAPGETLLVAYVVPATGASLDERAVRGRLAEKLPQFMLPNHLKIVEQLPEHASGKLDRVALARAASALVQTAAALTPEPTRRATVGQTVAEIWSEILGPGSDADIDRNFLDAGGDSLRLLRMHAELQKRLEISLDLVALFDHPTIRALSRFIEKLPR